MSTNGNPSSHPETKRPWSDRATALGTLMVGIAAVAALLLTWQSVREGNGQLQATEQGQITDRYTAAITDLGSRLTDVKLGGIYALQRIMQDSPRDQTTIIAVLCAFVRDNANAAIIKTGPDHPSADIQAALTVVGTRDTTHDSATVVDFNFAQLTGANLAHMNFTGADFAYADLTDSMLTAAHLDGADLTNAHLGSADLANAYLGGAVFTRAYLGHAVFTGATLVKAIFIRTCLVHAVFVRANYAGADFTDAIRVDAVGLSTRDRPARPKPGCMP
jgi:uncharacterized protein YjbI with pentapeptide repeats